MGGRGFRIGSIGGIPIRLDASWLWMAALITYTNYVDVHRRGGIEGEGPKLALAVLVTGLFLGSVLVHELAHAATARRLGIAVRGITLIFWGGFTETRAEERGPKGEFLVSAAGPGSSLLLGVGFVAASMLVPGSSISDELHWLGFINIALAALNSLPGFPLDGGRALQAVVWGATRNRRTAGHVAATVGLGVGIAMAALAAYFAVRGPVVYAFYAFFIAWVMISAGRGSERRMQARDALAAGVVADAMQPPPTAVPAALSLSEALDRYLRGREQESFPVVDDGRVIGMLSFRSARRIGADDPLRPVADGMVPLDDVRTVQATDRLDAVVDTLSSGAALVLDGERLVGSVRARDLEHWLNRRSAHAVTPERVPPRPDR
jgi:Zn-dependent protease/CBS domain-containing protein